MYSSNYGCNQITLASTVGLDSNLIKLSIPCTDVNSFFLCHRNLEDNIPVEESYYYGMSSPLSARLNLVKCDTVEALMNLITVLL